MKQVSRDNPSLELRFARHQTAEEEGDGKEEEEEEDWNERHGPGKLKDGQVK
jgi:hypothetical protein